MFLQYATNRALRYAPAVGRELGVTTENIQVDVAKVSGIRSVAWYGVSAKTTVVSASTISRPGARYFVTADYLGATLLSTSKLLIEAEGLRIDPIDGQGEALSVENVKLAEEVVDGRIAIANLQFIIEIDSLFSPQKELKKIITELRQLHISGKTNLGMSMQGKLTFLLNQKPRYAQLLTDTQDGQWVFRANKRDLAAVSYYFEEPLAEEEIELLARYPLRVAELMHIRDLVHQSCLELSEKDNTYPQQALQHVLWSFLLVKKFDVDFAKEITEAFQRSQESSKAVAAMNYSNQRVGRTWAEDGVELGEIQKRVRESEEVIRVAVE